MSYTYWPDGCRDECIYLNVANGNAHIPCGMMGFALEEYRVPVDRLQTALMMVRAIEADMFTRSTVVQGNLTLCGVTPDQAQHYKDTLIVILTYCIKHKVTLLWG